MPIKSAKGTFLTGRDVKLYLGKNNATKVKNLMTASPLPLHITQVSLSTQNQWSRALFLNAVKPSLISTGRVMSSLGFNNTLQFFNTSNKTTTPKSYANSTRFYLQIGTAAPLYVQGLTLSVSAQVQQVPGIGTNTMYTVPIPGAYAYNMQINRVVSISTKDSTKELETLTKMLGKDTILTNDVGDSGGLGGGKILTTEAVIGGEAVSLIIVSDTSLDTYSITFNNAVITAQSVSVAGGQFSMEGVSLEFDSVTLTPLSDTTTTTVGNASNSILYRLYSLVDTSNKHILPIDYVEKYGDALFSIVLVLDVNRKNRATTSGTPTKNDIYIYYKDCYMPNYSLSISAGAAEITESFSLVVGESSLATVSS